MNLNRIEEKLCDVKKRKQELQSNELLNINVDKYLDLKGLRYEQGISILVSNINNSNEIIQAIDNIVNQRISKNLLQIIVECVNEELERYLKNYAKKIEIQNNIIFFNSHKKNKYSIERFMIEKVKKEYCIFYSYDDFKEKNFLIKLYDISNENRIILTRIKYNDENPYYIENKYKFKYQEIDSNYNFYSIFCDFRNKLIPTKFINIDNYNLEGEKNNLIVFPYKFINNKYMEFYGIIDDNLNSIKENSLQNNIKIINELNEILKKLKNNEEINYIKQIINLQSCILNKYIIENKVERKFIFEALKHESGEYIPFNIINKGLAKELVISYCFPPYVDTSAIVMAKRLRVSEKVCDVFYQDMSYIRKKNYELNYLIEDLIENRIEIKGKVSFGNWSDIKKFCENVYTKIIELEKGNRKYEVMYSRSLFIGSHLAAFRYKVYNPRVRWIAEFSDPILYDINSEIRSRPVNDTEFLNEVKEMININNIDFKFTKEEENNIFFWSEYLPYIFADELVFTNENQLNYMVGNINNKYIKDNVIKKSRIEKQPKLERKFYYLQNSNYRLDNSKINFAYFGNLYNDRKLDILFETFKKIDKEYSNKYAIHIFTNNYEELKEELKYKYGEIQGNIEVNDYIQYLEFLNLSTKVDCLIVNDVDSKGRKDINPYLPSKLSDYMGSGTDIWAIYEEESILSKCDVKYKSRINLLNENVELAKLIIEDKLEQKTFNKEEIWGI